MSATATRYKLFRMSFFTNDHFDSEMNRLQLKGQRSPWTLQEFPLRLAQTFTRTKGWSPIIFQWSNVTGGIIRIWLWIYADWNFTDGRRHKNNNVVILVILRGGQNNLNTCVTFCCSVVRGKGKLPVCVFSNVCQRGMKQSVKQATSDVLVPTGLEVEMPTLFCRKIIAPQKVTRWYNVNLRRSVFSAAEQRVKLCMGTSDLLGLNKQVEQIERVSTATAASQILWGRSRHTNRNRDDICYNYFVAGKVKRKSSQSDSEWIN